MGYEIVDGDILKSAGRGSDIYVIAEAGVNHNGDMELARQLVDAAADAGADAVKFQTFRADRLVTPTAEQAEYQTEQTETESQYEMLKRYELTREAHEELQSYCDERDITFLSTPFDPESADMLDDLEVPLVKLGSGELDNHPLLRHVAEFGRPMVVSTGMGTLEEVRQAREVIRATDPDADLAFLHCTSCYPADIQDVNLRAMKTMVDELDVPVGYSDHTTSVEMPAMAVAAGADIVEKHFTVDRSLPGPDHEASLEPDELDRAITLARTAATARGSGVKEPTEAELENRHHIRKSLHAATDIDAGEVLTAETVSVLRPTDGLSPTSYDDVLGVEVTAPLGAGDPITDAVLAEDIE
ncbi:N-acetylneuraminate synthase [Haloarcula salinisoli]|uniref:N-acetylneuraminate synthase n=1 Tax=Haloarcula salinisoli TaxID=2487746 RepID=A0A8J7YKL0_9EURY|nr:N-acetylneuraminate synthase [Halomicroarcula salinisoli]MBX0288256.1 N-acetylneuraminate synthase [Halomicroarcula salinisoli]MBX0305418.1 N-acetylneuraminate synthase [Halomicroarcula salinisoli]